MATKNKISWKPIISFSLFFTAFFIALSGLLLYVIPHGNSGWTILGLSGHQWRSLHICFGLLMIALFPIHLFFNWVILKSNIKRFRHAFMITILLCAIIISGAAADLPPFSWPAEISHWIKHEGDYKNTDKANMRHFKRKNRR